MATNKLTAIEVEKAKYEGKPFKLADGDSMYLLVIESGKYWRLDYRFAGKRKTLALGVYPHLTLARARQAKAEAKQALYDGSDPAQLRKDEKQQVAEKSANTFEAVAREWHGKFKSTWAEHTVDRNIRIFEINAFPWIGDKPIADITPPDLLAIIRRVENRGYLDTAHRLKQTAGQVLRYGVATGRCTRDVSADLRGSLPPHKKTHFAAIVDPVQFGLLLRDVWAYQGSFITASAFKLSVLFGLRPGEVRRLEWSEVDNDQALISIPFGKMKKRRLHTVPIAEQARLILDELRPLTGASLYCFPGYQDKSRPMSENTINAALRRMGYDTQGEQSAHGFRASFSTLANESGLFRREVVEVQLSHQHGDAVMLAYNRGDYLEERRKLMAWWANECDTMRQGAEVISINQAA
jgi:integrase